MAVKLLKRIRGWFGALFRKRKLDAEMDEEMRAHVEMRTRENFAAGMKPVEARYAALRQFGWTESIKEDCREQRGVRWLENLAQDIRYGVRQLLKNPGFTAVVVVTLAVGIGATTAIFSVVNAVLLRPLPYPEPDRLVELTDRGGPIALPNFRDWKAQQKVFEHLFLYRAVDLNVSANQQTPMRVLGIQLSANAFATLRLQPWLGRFYSSEEDKVGGPRVTVLSHRFWRNQFGGDPEVVNKTLSINGTPYTVLGVAPAGFDLVDHSELFVPLEPGIHDSDRNNRKNQSSYEAVARLKSGTSLEQAKREMEIIAQRLAVQYPDSNQDRFIGIRPLIDAKVGGVRRALWILLGSVLLVLLIACANVANLLLVRAASRHKEMAVRSALGAGHSRILRQMLTESLLLAAFGAALGVLIAGGSTSVIGALAQSTLPRAAQINIDGSVLMFSTTAALVTGVLFGFAPAWRASRPNLSGVLNAASRGSSARRTPLLHSAMVAQVALSLVLLVGGGLLLRSFSRLSQVKAGFHHEQVVSFRLDLPDEKYPSPGVMDRFCQEMLERFRALPGIQAASVATEIPIDSRSWATGLIIEGRPEPQPNERPIMDVTVIGSDYFRVLGIPILQGRAFNDNDTREQGSGTGPEQPEWKGMKSMIIDEEFCRRYFANENPIGKQIRLPWEGGGKNPVLTVVGVVGRVKREKLREENAKVRPMGYLAYRERPNRHLAVVLKATLPTETLARGARHEVAAIDPDLPIYQVRTLAQMREDNIAPERLYLTLLGGAALIALALAAVGIYGVVAFSVAQRQREIGVRMALGAQRSAVLAMVLRSGLKVAGAGILLGLIAAMMLARLLSGLLFGVGSTDPLTFAVVPLLLISVTLIACWLPARRAARVDPMVALRAE